MFRMTTAPESRIPALTLGWRLKMALAHGDISREEMAANLGKVPSTLSRWMSDTGAPPARAFIQQWALATGVSPAWLEHGASADQPTPGTPGVSATPDNPKLRLAA